MALRLRRGTDAERQLITPLEGELVYVTDTKSLYVGDGNTQGGVLIATSGEVSNTLAGLLDTDFVALQDGDVIRYDQTTGEWINSQSALELDDILDVLLTGSVYGDVLFYDGNNWKNLASTDLVDDAISAITLNEINGVIYTRTPKYGDVLTHDGNTWKNLDIKDYADYILSKSQSHRLTLVGNDSTILVDPVTNTLRGTLEGDVYGTLYDGLGNLIIDEFSKAALVDVRDPTNTHTVLDNFTGELKRGENGQTIIQGGASPVFIGSVDGPVRGTVVGPDLNIILNHDTATLTGQLIGSVFTDDSLTVVDGLTGNVNTPLLTADDINASIITASLTDPFSGDVKDVEFVSSETEDVGIRIFRQAQVADALQTDIGTIYFDSVDKNAGDFQSTGSYITSTAQQNGTDPYLKTKISMGTIDGAGNPTSDNNFTITWEGNFGVGKDDPSTKLDVNGDIKASNSIAPGSFADATARDATITSPAAGMIVFLQDNQGFFAYVDDTGLAGGGPSNATPGWLQLSYI